MKTAKRYFDIIDSLVRHSPAVDHELSYEENRKGIGAITGTL
jgi:hypothetical protein